MAWTEEAWKASAEARKKSASGKHDRSFLSKRLKEILVAKMKKKLADLNTPEKVSERSIKYMKDLKEKKRTISINVSKWPTSSLRKGK